MDAILVVDDDVEVRGMLVTFLSRETYTVHQAANADDALDVLTRNPIAVIVCDRFMPGKDGLWLALQVCKLWPSVAIVLATADDAVPASITQLPSVTGYLVKPLDLQKLRQAIRDGVDWHRNFRLRQSLQARSHRPRT